MSRIRTPELSIRKEIDISQSQCNGSDQQTSHQNESDRSKIGKQCDGIAHIFPIFQGLQFDRVPLYILVLDPEPAV